VCLCACSFPLPHSQALKSDIFHAYNATHLFKAQPGRRTPLTSILGHGLLLPALQHGAEAMLIGSSRAAACWLLHFAACPALLNQLGWFRCERGRVRQAL